MKKPVIAAGALILGAVVWYLGAPLFIDNVVEEDFPVATTDTASTSDNMAEVKSMTTREKVKMMERLTLKEVEAMPVADQEEMKKVMNEVAQELPDTEVKDPMPAAPTGPQQVAQGSFTDADSFHKGSGQATVYKLEDDSHVVRFENFTVTNGPALSVFLTKGTDGTKTAEAIDLGKLKGNKGSQNYVIPAGIDPAEYGAVLIYCVPFKTPFAHASL